MYLSIFYCLYFVEEISVNISEKPVMEETYPYLEWGEYWGISDDIEEHWKEVEEEENSDRVKCYYMRWEVYMKEGE